MALILLFSMLRFIPIPLMGELEFTTGGSSLMTCSTSSSAPFW